MSNLLERAIIDAAALKEAALKNAEQLVIEKYSKEVKDAVNKILEQDMDPVAAPDLGADPFGMEPSDPLSTGEAGGLDTGLDSELEDTKGLDPESILGGLPDAFSTDDDEIIKIKLDSLDAEFEDEEEVGVFGGDDKYEKDSEIGIDILNDEEPEESEEEIELDLSDFEESPEPNSGVNVDITPDMVQEVMKEMGVEDDVDFEEIMEKVRVDFEPVKSGWAGTPESIMKEYEAMLLAREQDSEVKEENEELRKNVAALQKENKILRSASKKLQTQTEKYETAFETLHEKLETMNVSNAKLLYINQALENASLNERQRRKIVEAISKAHTVQEAKIVFETMNETVVTNSDVKRESTLNEVVSRRSSLLVAARNEQPKKDANPLYDRMQKLAGIKTQKS
tara:strand:- start:21 stop:1211 length:1191 start_codon:yes stop_codon:yes gene_type:complete